MNYAIFLKLCDRMQFEVNCAKSHHRVISDGLYEKAVPGSNPLLNTFTPFLSEKVSLSYTFNGAAFGKIQSRSVLKRQSGTPINVT